MMKKPLVFIIVGGLLLGLVGAGVYLYFFKKTGAVTSPTGADVMTPATTPKLLMWDDSAGFTMQYPEGLTLNKHDEDTVNYAQVELADNAHPGGLIIWVKDIPSGITDTASWGKKASIPSSAISFDTTLAGQSAQKILVSSPEKTVTVGVVYDGVLWYIEARLTDEPYWQAVYDGVVQSFTFKPIASAGAAGAGTNDSVGNVVADEEEVLE